MAFAIPQQEAVIDLLWDYLKPDPEHADRRMTGWGGKTKVGLVECVQRISEEAATLPGAPAICQDCQHGDHIPMSPGYRGCTCPCHGKSLIMTNKSLSAD